MDIHQILRRPYRLFLINLDNCTDMENNHILHIFDYRQSDTPILFPKKMNRTVPPLLQSYPLLKLPECRRVFNSEELIIDAIPTQQSCAANHLSLNYNFGAGGLKHNRAVADFIAPMLMQGTKRRSVAEIDDTVDFLGAYLNNETFPSYTRFSALSLNSFTPAIFELLEDVLLDPLFNAQNFDAIKRKRLAKYDLMIKKTSVMAQRELTKLIASPSHPYYCPLSRKDIENVTVEEIRHEYETGLSQAPLHIFLTGDIDTSLLKATENLGKTITSLHKSDIATPSVIPFRPSLPGTFYIEAKNSSQTSIAIGIPTIPRSHPDYIPLRISVIALGGYFGSRLMQNIRETKGLTYGISANLQGCPEGAYINISASCDKNYTQRVIEEVANEIQILSRQSMSMDELSCLKSYYMTTIASCIESLTAVAHFYEGSLTAGFKPDYFYEQQNVLQNITPEQIRNITAKYINFEKAIIVITQS